MGILILVKHSKQNGKKKYILNKGNRLNSKEKLLICCPSSFKKAHNYSHNSSIRLRRENILCLPLLGFYLLLNHYCGSCRGFTKNKKVITGSHCAMTQVVFTTISFKSVSICLQVNKPSWHSLHRVIFPALFPLW